MQVAVTPTGTDRRAITTPKGTSPDQSLLELSSVGGDRHRQRQFESPSDWFQLTVTHFVSSGLKRIILLLPRSRKTFLALDLNLEYQDLANMSMPDPMV